MTKKDERLSVRITPELKQKLKDVCKEEGLNQSDIIIGCIETYLELYMITRQKKGD